MNRGWLAAFSAMALGACAHSRLHQENGWSEVRTEHLIVDTDLEPQAAVEAVEQLERVEMGLLQGWWPGAEARNRPLHVVLLGPQEEIEELAASRRILGYYTPEAGLNGAILVAVAGEGDFAKDFNAQLPLKHELTHHLLESVMRQAPVWVNEGFATYMEGLELDRVHDVLRVGKPSPQRMHELANLGFGRWIATRADGGNWASFDIDNLMRARFVTDSTYEGRSWQLFFHLANSHAEALGVYLRLLWTGETNADAMKKAFAGMSAELLAKELTARYRAFSVAYSFTELPLPPLLARARIRPMTPAEMHAQLAELLWAARRERASRRAAAEARAALASDPLNVKALAVLAGLGQKDVATVQRCRDAAEAHPSDVLALELLASVLGGAEHAKERRELRERVLRLAPDDPGALNALAWEYVRQGNGRAGLAIAQTAADLAPDRADILDTLAAALAQSERCPEALEAQRRALELMPDGERWAAGRKRLAAYEAGCRSVPLE